MAATTLDQVDTDLRNIISSLYLLIIHTHDANETTTANITQEVKRLIDSLITLTKTARRLPNHIPIDIITYVEQSRNPDIYTRDFVEVVMKYNQQLKGKSDAFAAFRDILGREMMSGIPEIAQEVKEIVEATGGKVDA